MIDHQVNSVLAGKEPRFLRQASPSISRAALFEWRWAGMFAEKLDERQKLRRDGSVVGHDTRGLVPIGDCQLVARGVASFARSLIK
jgi:hypothetical protein